jgi:hypothetical protein
MGDAERQVAEPHDAYTARHNQPKISALPRFQGLIAQDQSTHQNHQTIIPAISDEQYHMKNLTLRRRRRSYKTEKKMREA